MEALRSKKWKLRTWMGLCHEPTTAIQRPIDRVSRALMKTVGSLWITNESHDHAGLNSNHWPYTKLILFKTLIYANRDRSKPDIRLLQNCNLVHEALTELTSRFAKQVSHVAEVSRTAAPTNRIFLSAVALRRDPSFSRILYLQRYKLKNEYTEFVFTENSLRSLSMQFVVMNEWMRTTIILMSELIVNHTITVTETAQAYANWAI